MKKLIFTAMLMLAMQVIHAQTTTIIIVRHAEKETSAPGSNMMQSDPPLSAAGQARAAKLVDMFSAFQPEVFYSTNYTRTKTTIGPLATRMGKEIQLYDPRKQEALASSLREMSGKTIVVVGHSNTAPKLVNLLLGEEKYPELDESIYNRYWIVTITGGKAEAKEIDY